LSVFAKPILFAQAEGSMGFAALNPSYDYLREMGSL
jgi:hypothetical protein